VLADPRNSLARSAANGKTGTGDEAALREWLARPPAIDYPSEVHSTLRRLMARLPLALGSIAMVSLVPLLAWDAAPAGFPARSHDVFGAGPLLAIAVAYFAQQLVQRPPLLGWVRAAIVVAAFFAWAVNQYLPDDRLAVLWNDIAIALFVIDGFLSIAKAPGTSVGRPAADAPSNADDAARESASLSSDGAL
jgi:hypothetical protein